MRKSQLVQTVGVLVIGAASTVALAGNAIAQPGAQAFFNALDQAQILQLGSIYSSSVLTAANRACDQRAGGADVTSINASLGQALRGEGLTWVTDAVAGGIVSTAFTQLCPR